MVEHEPQNDEPNSNPWYDLQCGTCYSVIATIHIVPGDKPVEPCATDRAVQARCSCLSQQGGWPAIGLVVGLLPLWQMNKLFES